MLFYHVFERQSRAVPNGSPVTSSREPSHHARGVRTTLPESNPKSKTTGRWGFFGASTRSPKSLKTIGLMSRIEPFLLNRTELSEGTGVFRSHSQVTTALAKDSCWIGVARRASFPVSSTPYGCTGEKCDALSFHRAPAGRISPAACSCYERRPGFESRTILYPDTKKKRICS